MKNKQIAFVSPGAAELIDIPTSEPSAGQVLTRLMVSTISSGTERANLVGDPNVAITLGASVVFPRYSGYSSAGIVEKVGEGVASVKPGDRVALSWSLHKHFYLGSETNVHLLGDISFSAGALVHIATFPMAALRKTRLELGESMIVMGLGVHGHIGVKLSKLPGSGQTRQGAFIRSGLRARPVRGGLCRDSEKAHRRRSALRD